MSNTSLNLTRHNSGGGTLKRPVMPAGDLPAESMMDWVEGSAPRRRLKRPTKLEEVRATRDVIAHHIQELVADLG